MTQTIDPCEHLKLRLIAAAVGLQQCTKTDGTEVLIPGTNKRILIGSDAYLAKVAAPVAKPREQQALYVECRECSHCLRVGINDASTTLAACHNCDWSGPSPAEDICPGCAGDNCMGAACPKCGSIYKLLAEKDLAAPALSGEVAPLAIEHDHSEGGHHD